MGFLSLYTVLGPVSPLPCMRAMHLSHPYKVSAIDIVSVSRGTKRAAHLAIRYLGSDTGECRQAFCT